MNLLAAPLFDPQTWAAVPSWFWAVTFVVLGAIVGSFLNVCIYRMPRGLSLMHPPSHCPSCGTPIRWLRNIPILAWLVLRGRCATCAAPIPARYVLVEALTAAAFGIVWLQHGAAGFAVALAFCLFVAGLIVATFIDFEHLIIPDEITLGGAAAGIVLSVVVPGIHGEQFVWPALKASLIGAALGSGIVFALLELGKLFLGRQRLELPESGRIEFTETELRLPDRVLPYEEVFYRTSDALCFHARRLEMEDRCYWNVDVEVRLKAGRMRIGEEEIDPSTVPRMEAQADHVTVPREAMGLGDVKFMATIGAFTGWAGALFALLFSSVAGVVINLLLIGIGKRERSAQIPFGPYLAGAALVFVLWGGGRDFFLNWVAGVGAAKL